MTTDKPLLTRTQLTEAREYFDKHGLIIREDGLLVGGDHHNFEPIPDNLNDTMNMLLNLLLSGEYVLVPKEPTFHMLCEMDMARGMKGLTWDMVYDAALSAAPVLIGE